MWAIHGELHLDPTLAVRIHLRLKNLEQRGRERLYSVNVEATLRTHTRRRVAAIGGAPSLDHREFLALLEHSLF